MEAATISFQHTHMPTYAFTFLVLYTAVHIQDALRDYICTNTLLERKCWDLPPTPPPSPPPHTHAQTYKVLSIGKALRKECEVWPYCALSFFLCVCKPPSFMSVCVYVFFMGSSGSGLSSHPACNGPCGPSLMGWTVVSTSLLYISHQDEKSLPARTLTTLR